MPRQSDSTFALDACMESVCSMYLIGGCFQVFARVLKEPVAPPASGSGLIFIDGIREKSIAYR